MHLKENLQKIYRRIAEAEKRSGRSPGSVCLIGASKEVDTNVLKKIHEFGLLQLGENRAQELKEKARQLSYDVIWHFIGHLQKNKVRDVVPIVSWIHSVDSISLAHEIEKKAAQLDKKINVLIEVNLSGESTKHGVSPEEAISLALEILKLPHLKLQGLMTLPPFFENAEEARPFFRHLRKLRDGLMNQLKIEFTELSMGMSHDFEIAIEEGSTMVRIGSAIFGKRG